MIGSITSICFLHDTPVYRVSKVLCLTSSVFHDNSVINCISCLIIMQLQYLTYMSGYPAKTLCDAAVLCNC